MCVCVCFFVCVLEGRLNLDELKKADLQQKKEETNVLVAINNILRIYTCTIVHGIDRRMTKSFAGF